VGDGVTFVNSDLPRSFLEGKGTPIASFIEKHVGAPSVAE